MSERTHESSINRFMDRWAASGAAERANCQIFLTELCEQLGIPKPEVTKSDPKLDGYVFERDVTFHHGDGTTSHGRIDLYKRDCFVLEAKQGSEKQAAETLKLSNEPKPKQRRGTAVRGTAGWDDAMMRARGQAERYAKALPHEEGWPPFLIVVDVGHSIELYSEFSRSGKAYLPFPDPSSHRIRLAELADEEVQERLRGVWTDPLSLDPTRRSAKVTRDLAEWLANLAKMLEADGYEASRVAQFLMRCLFTMFAEDIELIPAGGFSKLLQSLKGNAGKFPEMVGHLWQTMNTGGFSPILREQVLRFNGGLFADPEALPLTEPQLALLIAAADANWTDVEPAIFGTLLERALNPVERHKLGAHYTPRAYVERLVMPTIIEPLREEWEGVRAAAATLARAGKQAEAIREIRDYHERLCETRVLDPACGSGNFLYVTLEHMKRLEGEVLNTLREFGEAQLQLTQVGTVDPQQFLGIEINPRAAAIADLVLWIGYLQWHFRTRGRTDKPTEPVIKDYHNIEWRDAVLEWDSTEPVLDDDGNPVTHWDGRTTKPHPVTGEEVPDETARVPELRYINPRKAEWPQCDYVVGNPPFVGNKRMRFALGDGYVETLRRAYTDVPETVDYVMYWWKIAADRAKQRQANRFGLITTNSITHTFNRRVIEQNLSKPEPLSLIFAIPDHPWVDSTDGADVRIAMTVATAGSNDGILLQLVNEVEQTGDGNLAFARSEGLIHEDLRVGADVAGATALSANQSMSYMGMTLVGDFRLSREEVVRLGHDPSALPPVIRPYVNGREITQKRQHRYVIDTFGLDADVVRNRYPELFQWLLERVKPLRDQNKRKAYRDRWWVFGEPRTALRKATRGLQRFVVTIETSKFKPFVFLSAETCPDHKLYVVASDDAYILGTLSSRAHTTWALNAGGHLGVGNDPTWTNSTCFLPFPFPEASESQRARIRELGEALDGHRKRQQELHPGLTMTGMYNVLEKLRAAERPAAPSADGTGATAGLSSSADAANDGSSTAGQASSGTQPPDTISVTTHLQLTKKEREIHEQGLVTVLKQIHDDLDKAVFEAYDWPTTLTDEEILERLVALNHERTEEERNGLIRWLRPEFQNPDAATQATINLEPEATTKQNKKTAAAKTKKQPWPNTLRERAEAIRDALATEAAPITPEQLARRFSRANKHQVAELLETLA